MPKIVGQTVIYRQKKICVSLYKASKRTAVLRNITFSFKKIPQLLIIKNSGEINVILKATNA